ncbi:retrovirus-related pol polyprotein from transposon tnt [Lasius niger]|uniref:Retrovirus-related pol polyprotein from transposon tnt n=1 Tax=Lasius niger TaxID=67767 RepID=A0A0J7JWS0_LASNI|nr:retrovirus-related pol polyprotein from transposon tnt [Lasius niger]
MAAKEVAYVRKLVNEMGFGETQETKAYSDNQSSQCLVKNETFHARSKHIDIKYHYIRELHKNNIIEVNYVPTENMMADVLTKNLNRFKHEKCIQGMGLN